MSNVTLHPVICCPSCGARIEIAAKEVQAELPGLIYESAKSAGGRAISPLSAGALQQKKLDENFGESLKSNDNHHNIDDDISAQHPLWPQFRRYCNTRNGWPTLKGFRKWLASQAPLRSAPPNRSNAPPYDKLVRASQERADREIGARKSA